MMRSLYSGVSGLKVHQTKMDVIGNNIANVNTVAYKASSVTFSEVFYQTTQSASGANTETGKGGTNAKQIGLGSNVGAISTSITSEGASQRTDNAFDLKISGQSFFVVQSNGEQLFTRAGNFTLDNAGYLVTSTGAYVMGWQVDEETGEIIKDTVSPLQPKSTKFSYTTPEATTNFTVSGNLNKEDTNFKNGKPVPMSVKFYDSLGYEYTANINIEQSAADVNTYNLTLGDIYCNNKKTNLVLNDTNLGQIKFDANTGKPTGGTVDATTG
ncbi:MAG: flagellar hook-basal body complex protein, partial [Thermoflexaceae bacterium]|nr:flagellar hook-basal body complex protein [Thermoflexaceae bacterium]